MEMLILNSSNVFLWKSYQVSYPAKEMRWTKWYFCLSTKSKKLVLQLNLQEASNAFNTIKILTPGNQFILGLLPKQQVVVKAAAY
jgi:hypothetical protein